MATDDNTLTDSSDTGTTSAKCHPFEIPPFRGHQALRAYSALTGDAHQLDDPVEPKAAFGQLAWLLTDLDAWADERDIDFVRALVLATLHRPSYILSDLTQATDMDVVIEVAVDIVRDALERIVAAIRALGDWTPV